MKKYSYLFLLWFFLLSCAPREAKEKSGELPPLFPDYAFCCVPCNIAPLNFEVKGASYMRADFSLGSTPLATLTDPRFTDTLRMETFPAFSPDGRQLYFCSAPAMPMPMANKELKYALLRVGFDPGTGLLASQVDTLYTPQAKGGSASFPRLSPDGRYLLYTEAASATFPIWHKEADLKMIRLFIAHLDREGRFHKPFLLPQEDPVQNVTRLKSYNLPETATSNPRLMRYLLLALNEKGEMPNHLPKLSELSELSLSGPDCFYFYRGTHPLPATSTACFMPHWVSTTSPYTSYSRWPYKANTASASDAFATALRTLPYYRQEGGAGAEGVWYG